MQFETEVKGDVVVVRVNGDITLGKGGDVILKDKVNSLLQQGHRKILLDLGGVVRRQRRARAAGADACDDDQAAGAC